MNLQAHGQEDTLTLKHEQLHLRNIDILTDIRQDYSSIKFFKSSPKISRPQIGNRLGVLSVGNVQNNESVYDDVVYFCEP